MPCECNLSYTFYRRALSFHSGRANLVSEERELQEIDQQHTHKNSVEGLVGQVWLEHHGGVLLLLLPKSGLRIDVGCRAESKLTDVENALESLPSLLFGTIEMHDEQKTVLYRSAHFKIS